MASAWTCSENTVNIRKHFLENLKFAKLFQPPRVASSSIEPETPAPGPNFWRKDLRIRSAISKLLVRCQVRLRYCKTSRQNRGGWAKVSTSFQNLRYVNIHHIHLHNVSREMFHLEEKVRCENFETGTYTNGVNKFIDKQ